MGEVTIKEHERVVAGAHRGRLDLRHGLGDAAGTTLEALGWAFRDILRRRQLKRMLKKAGEAVVLGATPEGLARVEGRVETLEAVTDGDEPFAAFVRRTVADRECGCGPDCSVKIRRVETKHGAGRFLVRDDSGVAIIAGPSMRLVDYHGREVDPMEAGALFVRDGDSVTVVGTVRHEAVDDPRVRLADGYRGVKPVPVFHGEAEEPVHVFCPPRG